MEQKVYEPYQPPEVEIFFVEIQQSLLDGSGDFSNGVGVVDVSMGDDDETLTINQ